YKKVITWDGVTATPDHKVWAEEGRMLSLREASSEVCPLARTATADGIPVRWNADFKTENFEKGRKLLGNKWKMQSLWKRMGVVLQQSIFRKNKKLSLSEAQEISTGRESGNSRAKIRFYDSALQTGYARIVSQLQRERDKSIVREQRGFHMVGIKEVPGDRFQGVGLRQGEQRWSLFQGESQASYSEGKSSEYTTKEEAGAVRVYDIINAGPRRRFTCQGRLVSNCYGMWWKSYRTYARTDYGIHISESQAKQEWDDFFELYSDLPRWHTKMKNIAKQHGFVRALHGALRRLPAINSNDEKVQRDAERMAINSPIQRFASDLGLMGMSIFAEHCPWEIMHPLGFIHDATVIEAREEYADEAMGAMKWILENLPLLEWFDLDPPLPILADVSCGPSLGELEERPDIQAVRPEWLPENWKV